MFITHRVTLYEIMSVNSPGLTSLDIIHYREIMPHDVNRSASMLQLTCDVGFRPTKNTKQKISFSHLAVSRCTVSIQQKSSSSSLKMHSIISNTAHTHCEREKFSLFTLDRMPMHTRDFHEWKCRKNLRKEKFRPSRPNIII